MEPGEGPGDPEHLGSCSKTVLNPSPFQVGCLRPPGRSMRPDVDIEAGFKAILHPPGSSSDSNLGTLPCSKWPSCGGSDIRSEVNGDCRCVFETCRPFVQARTSQTRRAKWVQSKGTGSSENSIR